MLQGGCFCGHMRYIARGAPFDETNCHCSICRRTSGAPFVAWFSVQREAFEWASGTPHRFASSDHGSRTFCPRCGTPLTFESTHSPSVVDITICSLDDAERVRPRDNTQTSAKLAWVRLADDLPNFPQARG